MKYAFSYAAICAVIVTGCASQSASQKAAAQLGAAVMEPVFESFLVPACELTYASNQYRVANHRWPKDYDELSNFLKKTNDKTYSSFLAVKYHQVAFVEIADGKLRIDADYDYAINSAGTSVSGVKFSSDAKIRNASFVVSPSDPSQVPLPSKTASEQTPTNREQAATSP